MHMNYRNEDSDADEDDTEPSRYHPVSCTGLQPDSKVFVFGPEFQIEEDGAVISQENSSTFGLMPSFRNCSGP